ncbi:MAG: hypothetical protein KKB70_11090 [Proteobacteria bacterium]|nr:hypothetical protein [Pseudomonadota bacterium]
MKKYILLGTAAVLLLIVGAIVTLFLSIDSIIETALNEFGPKVTLTDVHLNEANIGVFSGSGELNELTVGNPVNRGFKPGNLFAMDQVRVSIDTDSLTKDTIVIKEVVIVSPRIVYELKDFSESNFDGLLKNIEETTGGGKAASATEDEAAPAKKIIIENLVISGAKVSADMTGLPGEGLTIPLPDIHLKDIGKEEGGSTPAQVAEELVSAIYASMQNAFAASGDFIMKGGQWVMEGGGKAAEEAAKAVGGVTDGAGDVVGGALEGVGKMFE